MAKVLVTGGLGVIGSHLVPYLENQGHEVHVVDLEMRKEPRYLMCDITKYEEVDEVFREQAFDFVFHLAATVGRYNGELYAMRCIDTNLRGTMNIIKQCIATGAKLVFTSTSEVYGDIPGPLTEDMRDLKPINIYGLTKLQAEEIIEHYRLRHGLQAMVYRIFNCYGSGEYPNFYRSVLTNFIYSIAHDHSVLVHKDCSRSWCYIEEVAQGLALAMSRFRDGETYNIGIDDLRSIDELAELICDILGKPRDLICLADRGKLDVMTKRPDFSKARKELRFEAKIRLEEGLARTVEWHKMIYSAGFTQKEPIFSIDDSLTLEQRDEMAHSRRGLAEGGARDREAELTRRV